MPLKMDSEGALSASTWGKRNAVLSLGLLYLSGKLTDDLMEEGIRIGFRTVTRGTATVVSRYVGIGTGVMLLVLRRGKDLNLPKFTEIEITFSRPVVFPEGPNAL